MPIICPSCKKTIPDNSILCMYCSQPVNPPIKCKNCGRDVPAIRTQCLFCGTAVDKPKPSATPPSPPAPVPEKTSHQPTTKLTASDMTDLVKGIKTLSSTPVPFGNRDPFAPDKFAKIDAERNPYLETLTKPS